MRKHATNKEGIFINRAGHAAVALAFWMCAGVCGLSASPFDGTDREVFASDIVLARDIESNIEVSKKDGVGRRSIGFHFGLGAASECVLGKGPNSYDRINNSTTTDNALKCDSKTGIAFGVELERSLRAIRGRVSKEGGGESRQYMTPLDDTLCKTDKAGNAIRMYALLQPGAGIYVNKKLDSAMEKKVATCQCGAKLIKLNEKEYSQFEDETLFSYIVRVLRLVYGCKEVMDFLRSEDFEKPGEKGVITITCSDAIQGYERSCLLIAVMCVCEAKGDISEIGQAYHVLCMKKAQNVYNTISQSVGALLKYNQDNAESIPDGVSKRVVVINYECGGFSICDAEQRKDGCNILSNNYVVGQGGKAIEDAIFAWAKGEIESANADIKINNDKASFRLLKAVREANAALVESSSHNIEYLQKGHDDVSITISREIFEEQIRGILDVFKASINECLKDVSVIDTVIMLGMPHPVLQGAVSNFLKGKGIDCAKIIAINAGEFVAQGASYADLYKIKYNETGSKKHSAYDIVNEILSKKPEISKNITSALRSFPHVMSSREKSEV